MSLWEGSSAGTEGAAARRWGPAPGDPATELTSGQGIQPLAPYPVQCPLWPHPHCLSVREVGQSHVVICRSLPPPAYVFTLHSHLSEKMQTGN